MWSNNKHIKWDIEHVLLLVKNIHLEVSQLLDGALNLASAPYALVHAPPVQQTLLQEVPTAGLAACCKHGGKVALLKKTNGAATPPH